MRLTFRQEIQGGAILQPNPLIIAAKDVQGDWWDCMQGVRIEDMQTWWADQLTSLALPIIGLEATVTGRPDGPRPGRALTDAMILLAVQSPSPSGISVTVMCPRTGHWTPSPWSWRCSRSHWRSSWA